MSKTDPIPAHQCLRTADEARVLASVIRFPALEGGGFTVEGEFLHLEHDVPLTVPQFEFVLSEVFFNSWNTVMGVPVYGCAKHNFARSHTLLDTRPRKEWTTVTVEMSLEFMRCGVRDDKNPAAVLAFRDRWLQVVFLTQALEP